MRLTKIAISISASAFLLLAASAIPLSLRAASKPIVWKPVANAILEITGQKPPKKWSVLQDQKNKRRVLVQLDGRYLVVNAKTKQVFEITAAQISPHGKDFESADPADTERALPSSDWDIRDVGVAERIQFHLTGGNATLDVELPHPLALRTPY